MKGLWADSRNITSLQNERVKAWRSLKDGKGRALHAQFLAEGEHMAGEALQANAALSLLINADAAARFAAYISQANARNIPVYTLAPHVMAALCDAKTPQGIAAVCPCIPKTALPDDTPRLAALDGVQDPGNVGAVMRTLDAAGFDALLLDGKTADPYSPKALRAGMGAIFRVPVVRTGDMAQALAGLAATHDIYAGALDGEPFFDRARQKPGVCIVIGSEGAGVSQRVLMLPGLRRVKLPMPGGAESLNAAVAAGIMVYDVVRRGE